MEFSAEGYATRPEEELTQPEEAVEELENPFISIILEKDRVKYDTNLPVQDMVFWMETVKAMLLQSTVSTE